ncbi:hypothetical protein [Maioricimonas sp. JC845]|uniref:hypothetical protein n=1 Tax=Maioricimonas sp. JC845 TaxID=3232138 RepID=UPI003457CC59
MASRRQERHSVTLTEDDQILANEILAHLNFSGGRRDPQFFARLNRLWNLLPPGDRPAALQQLLLAQLDQVRGQAPTFTDCAQVEAVIPLALTECLSAYRQHHADLLFHLQVEDFEHPFLLAGIFEAVLAQSGPWNERDRIIEGALQQLNDFVGYRPVAVLENGRKMELYAHERFRAVPVYVEGAGVAYGKYHDLIERTLEFLREAPEDIVADAHLDLDQLSEVAVDMRAHDHLHPVNKRTNYMFGEWDPDWIDIKGRYRRFVIRKIILDALVTWVEDSNSRTPREERLFDAAAALCGTMLMASSISGSGPETHDSSISLTTLLPIVARRRDAFYTRLMEQVDGARARRLLQEQKRTQQPFGHVRQFLNMHLSGYGARQVQHRELAYLYAQMGYSEASRRQANAIPAASIRFESEIQCQLASAHRELDNGNLDEAVRLVAEARGLLHRGIACGAMVDPWNILGFHGQFPLFSSREDAIPDNRIETLFELVERLLTAYSRVLGEAAAQGDADTRDRLTSEFRDFAEWWDQFGSDAIEDLPDVSGHESWDSAIHVSEALTSWRHAGSSAGDISFWREHVGRFSSAQSYAQVVDALLDKQDHVAAMGLLMQWLSQSDEVGVESPRHSVFALLMRWIKLVAEDGDHPLKGADRIQAVCRLFDFLEANAGPLWQVPSLQDALDDRRTGSDWNMDAERPEADDNDADDDENSLFSAAYEGITFRDSTDDGNWGDTLENEFGFQDTEFEQLNRELEPRLKFLNAVGQMWQIAAVTLASDLAANEDEQSVARARSAVEDWATQGRRWQSDLWRLMQSAWEHEIASPSGAHDANVEYDLQLQVKFYLVGQIITTLICLRNAVRLLEGCATPESAASNAAADDARLAAVYAAIVQRDHEQVRKLLPALQKWMEKQPLLYVPFDNGGTPEQILRAQTLQSAARFLLTELPRLGLFRETWHILQTAFRMERRWRPEGPAITEFDRLFEIAFRSSLECTLQSATKWRSGRLGAEELIELVGGMSEPYQWLWLKHSSTMRLSAVDGIRDDKSWQDLSEFIHAYGQDLFHASQLTLGNVRAILHNSVAWYLDYLEQEEDPLRPMRLISDIREGKIDRSHAEWCLETIYSIVVDKFDRFLEYNTTTTQSDYGEMFFCLLEFLRAESRYDRDAWNLLPVTLVHEILARSGHTEAATVWATTYEAQTADLADQHLEHLEELERRYGMRMPAIADHLNQRFVKPLAVNRMLALVKQSVDDARRGRSESATFSRLESEVEDYLHDSWGSGVDIPSWLRNLEKEVAEAAHPDDGGRPAAEADLRLPVRHVGLRDFKTQLRQWRHALGRDGRSGRKTTRKRSSNPPSPKKGNETEKEG